MADPTGSGLSVFNWSQKDNEEKLLDVLTMPNLLAPKRLVVVREMIEYATDLEKDVIVEYLKKNEKSLCEDSDLIVVFWENGQPKKNGKVYKLLEKIAKAQCFDKLTGTGLNKWINARVGEIDMKAQIATQAVEKLILFVGSNTGALDSELHKLVDYANGDTINGEMVDLLVKSDGDINIFDTIDALANNNKKEALRLIHEHLKKGEDAFYLFSMIVYQFRNLLKVADVKEQYHNSEYAISKALALHPFVVKKNLQQLRNFSLSRLKEIYQKLGQLDAQSKTGKIDIRLALDKFIVEL